MHARGPGLSDHPSCQHAAAVMARHISRLLLALCVYYVMYVMAQKDSRCDVCRMRQVAFQWHNVLSACCCMSAVQIC